MSNNMLIVILVTLTGAAALLFTWRRRDRGVYPEDGLPEALHEMLERRPKS